MSDLKKSSAEVDVFAKIPEFLAAFDNVLKNGHFEAINFSVRAAENNGKTSICNVSADGYVASDDKYHAEGCTVIVNPNEIVAKCREMAMSYRVKSLTAEVKTEDWPLWDNEDENIVGSKGQRVKMSLMICFATW